MARFKGPFGTVFAILITVPIVLLSARSILADQLETVDSDRPNLILLMIDDMSAEAFSCYGGLDARTPRIDALAETGIRYTHAYAQPLCTPSRVQIMTGQSNFRNYVEFGYLDPDETTFADLLRSSGYRTGVFGKWQLSGSGPGYPERNDPDAWGFDRYCLWQLNFRPGHRSKGSRFWNPLVERDGRVLETNAKDFGPDLFTNALLEFVDEDRTSPFVAYFPMALTHTPYVPTPSSDPEQLQGSPSREGPVQNRRYFIDMVEYVDEIVGRIVDHLESTGLADRTVLILTSDNGTGREVTMRTASGPIRGAKSFPTEAGMHAPLIVWGPGRIAEGRVDDRLVDLTDVLPTLLALADIETPSDLILDGRPFLDVEGRAPVAPREWIYCYYDPRHSERLNTRRTIFARDHRYKLDHQGRLYDLVVDPLERPESVIAPEQGSAEAEEARIRLQAVLDQYAQQGARLP